MSRISYLRSIDSGQTKVFECMKKFTDKSINNPNFVPDDFVCLSRISNHWAKISGLCEHYGCGDLKDSYGWKGQHRHFVKTLGYLKKEFDPEIFDEDYVFGK